ncbi:cadherin-13 [Cricetulus griseus]|nr:cadherin-13 [Cricetulus griseus]
MPSLCSVTGGYVTHRGSLCVLLFVETTDVSGKTLEGPVPLEVIVIDQNDNRPIFREGPYVGHVMEGSPTEDS